MKQGSGVLLSNCVAMCIQQIGMSIQYLLMGFKVLMSDISLYWKKHPESGI